MNLCDALHAALLGLATWVVSPCPCLAYSKIRNKVSIPRFTSLYAENALMNSSLRVFKSVTDLKGSPGYHFMAFPSREHLKESMWLYKTIAFRYDIIWLEGSKSLLKYFTLGHVNLSGGASQARALERGSPP
ncbi:hypothetical protein ACFX2I_023017 [Malus domestica]|uniref:Uncharacterized protein n=1 Tax=Malus domestica TaxID=3750 RepID=A0A498HLK3_MALDO|nr:hypothetical protein DVH24_015796 [Malus domestica]